MMEEISDKNRKYRKILFSTKHFPEGVINRKLFTSLQKADEITIKAIKNSGILIEPFMKDDCKYLCLFRSDLKIIVCCPIKFVGENTFFVPTIFKANKWQTDVYKELIKKRKSSK